MIGPRLTPVERPQKLFSYWTREKPVVVGVILTGVVFNGGQSLGPVLQGRLIDTIVDGAPLFQVLTACGLLVGTVLLLQLFRFFKRYFVRLFANRTTASMRRMLYNNILSRSVEELTGQQAGDLMTRAAQDVDLCVEGMRKVTTEVFDTGVLMLSYLTTLLLYDWKLTILSCLFVPVAMALAEHLKKVIVRYAQKARTQSSRVANLTLSSMEHTVLLRVNGLEGQALSHYEAELDDLEDKTIRATILENSMQPVYYAMSLLGIGFVLLLGGRYVIAGRWTVGAFSAYITVFTALATKASKAAKLFNAFQKASVSWRRIQPWLQPYVPPAAPEPADVRPVTLEAEQLSFTWPGAAEPVLAHVTFTAATGDLVGITGPIACGKTSLGLALQGMFSYGGSIRLNGRELSAYTSAQRSGLIAAQSHAPMLLSDTIYQNITLGREGDVAGVLRDVCFDRDLAAMPDGIHTLVGSGGVRLSGGQQARIALARALYQGTPVLILDDPLSAVDMATEQTIIQNLRERYRDRLILLISHRLAVFPQTDQVLLFTAAGEVVSGTHAGLLETSDLYRSIYELQMGGADHETA